jgi:translation initiation factor eIF-2B subunit epsilon
MPAKKTASKDKEEKGPVEVIAEEPIQAVVLADSFNRRFEVLCVDKPRVSLELRQGSTHTIRQSSYGRFVI